MQDSDSLAKCWQDLGADNAEAAYRAILRLARNPGPAVKLLQGHLQPARAPDQEQIQTWLKDLSSAKFVVRERAFKGLRALEELAAEPLRRALEAKGDLETRRRVESLLANLDQPIVFADKLRMLRAVEVLEMLATPQAKELLQSLAIGYPDHRQTQEARQALARLELRKPTPERWVASTKGAPSLTKDDSLPVGARTRLGTKLFRHQDQPGGGFFPAQAFFSPDGSLVISHDRSSVYLWETQTGKLRQKFDIAAECLAAAPKDALLALGLANYNPKSGAIVYWDWQAGKEIGRVLLPPGVLPRRLAFRPDGSAVIGDCSDDQLRAWNVKSGQESTLWQPADGLRTIHGFSADAARLATSSKSGNFVVDLVKNEKHSLPAMSRQPRQAIFSPDGKYVAVYTDYPGERLHICDAASGTPLWRTGEWVGSNIFAVSFTADGKRLATGGYRQPISLWDLETGKYLRSLAGSEGRLVAGISTDGRWLVSVGQSLKVWNLETGQPLPVKAGHRTNIEGLALAPLYDRIVTHDSRYIDIWDPLTGAHKRLLDTGGTFIRGMAVSPDGRLVAAANPGPGVGFIKVWETDTGRLVYALAGHAVRDFGSKADVQFTPDGRFLMSWGDDNYLRKWDVKTGKALLEMATSKPGQARRRQLDFGEASQHGWTAGFERFLKLDRDGVLHTFDLSTGKEGPTVKLGPVSFNIVSAFSPAAKHVVLAGRNDGAAVYDMTSGKRLFALSMTARPHGLVFSPDGRALAAALDDHVLLTEMLTGKTRMSFPAKARALTFAPDGRFLATAMSDTTALLWDLAILSDAPANRAGQ